MHIILYKSNKSTILMGTIKSKVQGRELTNSFARK